MERHDDGNPRAREVAQKVDSVKMNYINGEGLKGVFDGFRVFDASTLFRFLSQVFSYARCRK